ncbi:MAG: hypothetical protein IKM61_08285 [Eubacteriaceae bacterium]|nr:hypothetical protein [Eubacteriaceae bacterium]
MNEFLGNMKDILTPLSLLLITALGIIENSRRIAAKPLTKLLSVIGKRLNHDLETKLDDIRLRQIAQEAYYLNDFYHRHIMGEALTIEQYELAIDMFEKHFSIGANSVNRLHYEVIKAFYMENFV